MITRRSIIIGLILSCVIGVGEPFTVLYIHGSALCADFSTGGAIFLFFLLVFLSNLFAKSFLKKFYLKPNELITVYIMMLVACAIPSWGFTMNLIGLLGGMFYYATPANKWETLIHPHLPGHLFPQNKEAIWYLYEGLPKGMQIPWSAWFSPLLNWFLFILVFYFMSICIMVILRKQWVENEKLTYPLAELPKVMVNEKVPFYKSRLMWMGFAIPAILYSLKGLHAIYPLVPDIQLRNGFSMMRRSVTVPLWVSFEIIGLSFFMSTQVLLSIWVFGFFYMIETGVLKTMGIHINVLQPFSDPAPVPVACQSLGALLALSISCLWMARAHMKKVFLKAIGKMQVDDSEEILSYKVSFWGFVASFIFSIWWINKTGLRLMPSIFFTFMAVLIFLGITRIIAQAGLAYYRAPVIPAVPTISTFGTNYLGPGGLASLGMTFAWATDIRTLVMASTATGLKLSTEFKLNCRRLFWAIFAAIIVSLISSAWCTLYLGYKYGGLNLQSWQFSGLARFAMQWIRKLTINPTGFGKAQFGFVTLGAGMMFLLRFLRNHLLWWPLRPIGLAVGMAYPAYLSWFSFLIAWVIKTTIMKYFGIPVYNKAKEFFLGLVLGAFVTAGVWVLIGFLTGVQFISFTLG